MLFNFLIFLVIGLFVAMLFLNVYFRVKVLKAYRFLIKNRVEFTVKEIFNKKKMEAEVYPKYPQYTKEIDSFARHIRYSVNMAIVLIFLITLFGGILMYFRHE
ncbi:MAG: hypothetical protein IPI60_09040 [Saprospiraceae bacterium]|jgi:hypothetical protein|nr:hypothetical protein [Saprospiraceae bacterium]